MFIYYNKYIYCISNKYIYYVHVYNEQNKLKLKYQKETKNKILNISDNKYFFWKKR